MARGWCPVNADLRAHLADATTRATQVRDQISALADQGLDSVDIAARLGVTVTRVDQVLDQLAGLHVAALPKLALPVRHPAGPPPPKIPTFAPGGLLPSTPPEPKAPKVASVPAPKPEVPALTPATKVHRGGWPTPQCGTRAGYQAHRRRREEACGPCVEANRQDQRDRKAQLRAAPAPKPKVLVHWLIPRGATMDGAHLEYAVTVAGQITPCSFATAELAAAHGETVLSRWATDWRDAK